MKEIQIGLMYKGDNLIREENINHCVTNMPAVWLPDAAYDEESAYGTIISQALSEGSIDHNWMVTAYARTTVPPLAALNFAGSQFLRFGMPVPPKNFLIDVFKFLVYHVDYNHPELFFHGLTNVTISNDKFYYTYRFLRLGGHPEVVPLEQFDVYTTFPASKHNFEWLMMHPGLSSKGSERRPYELENVWDMLVEASDDCDFDLHFGEHWREYFGTRYRDVVHLGVWATLMWMIKPDAESATWRKDAMPIFEEVEAYGECAYMGGDYWHPGEFEKIARPVGTCIMCGIKLPCCEIFNDDNPEVPHASEYFCRIHRPECAPNRQHYVNYSLGKDYECSSCSFTECPYNNVAKLVVQAPRGRGQILRNSIKKIQNGTMTVNSDIIDI